MSDINTVTLTGRLGRNPELRETTGGTKVLEMSLAVQSGWGDKEKVNWIGLVFWGASAEAAARFLSKGRKIAISGRLDQTSWEDKDNGKKQSKTKVVVGEWTFADGQKTLSGEENSGGGAASPSGNQPDMNDDDIPF